MKANIKKLLIAVRDGVEHWGQNSTYSEAIESGWIVWDDANTARNIMGGYVLTAAGREALAPKTVPAKPHARGCKCYRCVAEHMKGGCRSTQCKTCGF